MSNHVDEFFLGSSGGPEPKPSGVPTVDILVTVADADEVASYSQVDSPGHDGSGRYLFPVAHRPVRPVGARLYVAFKGAVIGYHRLIEVCEFKERQILGDRIFKSGIYLRHGLPWVEIPHIPIKGFRGFRYVETPFPEGRPSGRQPI